MTPVPKPPTAAAMITALRTSAEPTRIAVLQGFFKTGPGQYGEGDRFIGVRLPVLRVLVRQFQDARLAEVDRLLASPIHEARLLAVLLLVRQFHTAKDDTSRRRIYDFYLSHAARINSWDLVDVSAPGVVGRWLFGRNGAPLRSSPGQRICGSVALPSWRRITSSGRAIWTRPFALPTSC